MATGTPFHHRTSALCKSFDWRQWSGYLAPSSYNDFVQPEYAAIRHAAALIDISPLYKYWVSGADAEALLDRVMTQDLSRTAVGRVVYTPWCDSDGRVRQEGTVFRLGEQTFQVCAAEPALGWLRQNAAGFDVRLDDRSTDFAALSLQGPLSRQVLLAAGAEIAELGFFRLTETTIDGVPVTVSRTGYTGDLGYELWIPVASALRVWDALLECGVPYQAAPCGLLAMDVARVEAGFVLINVDYQSSELALTDRHTVTPYELGLGWTVKLGKQAPFVGRAALAREKASGSARRVVGLELEWESLEAMHLEVGLMPDLPLTTCRESVPVFRGLEGPQVGRATTRVWSKLLKKYLAIATVRGDWAHRGGEVAVEVTIDYRRRRCPARVVELPFFRPERMRS